VQAGARTGLSSIVVAVCLIAALFFQPLVHMVIGDFQTDTGAAKFPTIAPALIVVGAMMLRTIRDIDWDEPTEYIPGALTAIYIPVSYSIADGIALGLVTYVLAKVFTGRWREVSVIVYIFAVLLSLRYFLPY
ncbi:MAG: NCS2 family permease, partial [Planctomycetota bacterium]